MKINEVNKKTLLKAFELFVNWAEECDFGYDNIPEEYEKYETKLVEKLGEDYNYIDGLMWIAYWEAEEEQNEIKRNT